MLSTVSACGPTTKKGSFLKIDEACVHEDGTPLQVRAKVVSKDEIAKLLKIHETTTERTKTALERAANNWPETPTAGLIPGFIAPGSSSIVDQGTLEEPTQEASASIPDSPADTLPPNQGDGNDTRSAIAGALKHNDAVSPESQLNGVLMSPQITDNRATHDSSTDACRPPGTLMDHLALQTAASGSDRQGHDNTHDQTQQDQLREPLNPVHESQRVHDRKRKADSSERDGGEARRRYD